MKFMANGAVTLGTLDGANVEIHELVGDENIAVFGRRSDEVIALYESGGYKPAQYAVRPEIKPLLDFIVGDELEAVGDRESLERLHKNLTQKDYFMTLLDLEDYIRVKHGLLERYEDRLGWAGMMLVNIAKSGYFSSDRTIAQYNEEIWRL